jgi:hypothetical protein
MFDFVVSVRIEVFQYLATLKRAERERIIRWIEALPRGPLDPGDYSERDAAERNVQVKIVGRHALSYWCDGPVNEIKVVKIQLAGS